MKEETGSKLKATGAGRFLAGMPVAIAGANTREAAAATATILAPLRCATLSTFNSLSGTRYSQTRPKVPCAESIPLTPVADSTQLVTEARPACECGSTIYNAADPPF